MSRIHPAARIFTDVASEYEAGRPGYPDDLLHWLVARGLSPGSRVLDVAAGTGKLTRLLVRPGAKVIALEPLVGMLAQLRTVLPDVPAVAAAAEQVPLATGSIDLVTVAQAFHWFDRARALLEMRRVLMPGGALALVWNTRDDSSDWMAEVSEIVDPLQAKVPRYADEEEGPVLFDESGFGPCEKAVFHYSQRMDHGTLLERFRSTSYIASLPEDQREDVLGRISEVVDREGSLSGEFDLPYITEVYLRRAV